MKRVDILLLPDDDQQQDHAVKGDSLPVSLRSTIKPRYVNDDWANVPSTHQENAAELARRAKRIKLVSARIARFIARLLDFTWEGLLVSIAVTHIMNPFINSPPSIVSYIFLYLLVLPTTLLLDTFIQGVLGNTPGKMLMGVKVITWRGARLDFQTAFNRNFLFWRSAVACGFLPLIPFTMFNQYRLVGKGDRTSYDSHQHLRVRYEPYPVVVQGLVLLVILGSLLFPMISTDIPSRMYRSIAEFDISRIRIDESGAILYENMRVAPTGDRDS